MEPLLPLDLRLPPAGSRTRAQALHGALRSAILDGRLAPGLRLPSTRALAASLGVGRNTVIAAYGWLLGEAYIEARPGSGHQVSALASRTPPAARRPASRTSDDPRLAPLYRGLGAEAARAPERAWAYDFRLGVPDAAQLPQDLWRRLSARSLRALARRDAGYASAQGQPALREAIAAHVSLTRAVSCGADDILVTSGAQQAFDLLARVLVTAGQTVVAVEHPGYPPTCRAFEAAGARIVRVPVDDEGLVVERLPPQARVICVTPSHQFPLGCVMSPRRRADLLAFAQRHHAVIVEDDYDAEFRYAGRPLDALQTLDGSGTVCYVGTFSKSLFPALRLGFVVAPPWALAPLVAARERADWHGNLLVQQTLAAFMAEGHLARHVRKMRGLYAQRRAALLQGLASDCGAWLSALPGEAGLHLAARTAPQVDADRLVERARAEGIGVSSIARYGTAPQVPAGLLFGFGAITPAAIRAGLARLADLA
ncbi:MAG: PLP-dependent aminotransferase family protein [Proteobacteria bacterium]|nr:PLP-dependent aminotransferase family protein [Pseudomonadota bacterium]